MQTSLLALLLSVFGYSILNVSQAVQKIGLSLYSKSRVAGAAVWTGALVASGVSFGIVFIALSIGTVSVVGAAAGTGLVSLVVFSAVFLGEPIRPGKIVAIVAIVGGAALVALFPVEGIDAFRRLLLWVIPAVITVAAIITIVLLPTGPPRGTAIAGLSGFLGAYSQLFQKRAADGISGAESVGAVAAGLLHDPINLVWIGLSAASMVVIQFAYRHAEATRIIPVFTALFIITPVLGGIAVYGERLSPLQWFGVAVISAGAVVLGGYPRQDR
jgi:drug/metabolite transporter (DMT)-like permease